MIPNTTAENKYDSFWLSHAVENKVCDCYGGSCVENKELAVYTKNESKTE